MILKILIGLAAVFAIVWTINTEKTFPTIITVGMILGIVLALFPSKTIQIPGFYVYMGFVALAFIYGLTVKEKKIWVRIIISLMSVSIFAYWLWVLNHWHGNAVLAPIFVLLIGIAGIISKAKLKNELGFLIILAIDAITIIIENWMKAN
ncbi:MAG: hypothetical protein K8R58_13725 [Bacteroidales bacterium]|nr:hypothetical protein [Bacteroidales bacterium]